VSYAARSTAVTVSLNDNLPFDGDGTEGDDVETDVENIDGTYLRDDTLIGNASTNVLRGWGGRDTLTGLGGDDTLDADDGFDDRGLDCGAGNDRLLADLLPFDALTTSCETVTRN
jgi:Ca2+-binding RTX toxin-like protein